VVRPNHADGSALGLPRTEQHTSSLWNVTVLAKNVIVANPERYDNTLDAVAWNVTTAFPRTSLNGSVLRCLI
jgi:hypothetical protein